MKKKKVLIFHSALATYRVDQFNALNELYDVEVVFLLKNLWYYKMNQDELLSQSNFRISYLLKGPRYKGRMFRFGVYRKIRKVKPDIILSYEYSLTTQYLLLLKQMGLINQKIGTLVDDSMDICYNVQSTIRLKARNYAVKRLDYLVLLSDEVLQFYKDTFNLNPNQLIVSPILQQPEKLRRNARALELIAEEYIQNYNLNNKKVLLYVGRLVEVKAIPLFIRTIKAILEEEKDLLMILIGDGTEKEKLTAFVKENDLEKKVLLLGEYQGEELHGWYLSASGLVLPSIWEPFGAVINEALIFGLPVFCSSLAGASSWIKEEHGMIFNPLSSLDTQDRFKSFINKIDAVDEVDLGRKKCLMDFSIDKFNKEWKKLEQ
jgi:glycosyltransferase involved in cell wall biosynthesis